MNCNKPAFLDDIGRGSNPTLAQMSVVLRVAFRVDLSVDFNSSKGLRIHVDCSWVGVFTMDLRVDRDYEDAWAAGSSTNS
jgi:hypothetical protein